MAPSRNFSPIPLSEDNGRETVYLLDTFHPDAVEHCRKRFNTVLPGQSGHCDWRENARFLLIRSSCFTAEDANSCPNLLAIGKQGVGIDKLDSKACAARGIKIFNTPGANARAVAEIVLALTTSIAREIGPIAVKQSQGLAVPKETCSGLILHQKTIGVLGMGNIGKTVAKIFKGAFESPVVAYDPYLAQDAWSDLDHTRMKTVEEVLKIADIVTIHVPLTPETRCMISYAQLQLMKPTAILINSARGGIVNEVDLERALSEGLIWGAGLDCHEQEPPTKAKYGGMWQQRVVSTPHVGAATAQTQLETATAAIDRLYEYSRSRRRT